MIKINRTKLIPLIIVGVLIICSSVGYAQPKPGIPQRLWGTVKDAQGSNVPDSTTVKAIVGDENYTTTVVNGTYGYYTPFYVEDPYQINSGKVIYFFVMDINTTQTTIFESGVTIFNLTVDLGGNNDNNGGSNSQGEDQTGEQTMVPVADIGGPYFSGINNTVFFNASASYDSDGEIVSYSWNFGDDARGSGMTTSHIYNRTGVFNVTLLVTDDNGLFDTGETTVTIFFDSDGDGWGDKEETEYGTHPDNSSSYPLDTDGDHIPDSVDTDDDNDGLSDAVENLLGSSSIDPADVTLIQIAGDVHYLVDTDADGKEDTFYNSTSMISTLINITAEGLYLLDVDGDGNWDYVYNPTDGTVLFYQEESMMETDYNVLLSIIVIFIIGICVSLIITVIIINRRKIK